MKLLAMLAVLVIFAPIAAYAQAPQNSIFVAGDSTNIQVTIQGEIMDDGVINLTIRGPFGSEPAKAYFETATVSSSNPTHVFELNYPFKSNEAYVATVRNGYTAGIIEWIPVSGESSSQVQQTATEKSSADSIQSVVMEENNILSQEIDKKQEVVLEQLKVIQDLASKLKNAVYEKGSSQLQFVVDDNSLDSVIQENGFLREELENKDAIIMAQIKVIQDLAEKLISTNYDSASSSFILV